MDAVASGVLRPSGGYMSQLDACLSWCACAVMCVCYGVCVCVSSEIATAISTKLARATVAHATRRRCARTWKMEIARASCPARYVRSSRD